MDFTRKVGIISVFSFLSVVVSVVYTLVIANIFGVSRDVEIYFAASQFFMVLLALTQSGQLTEAFIPIFHKLKKDYGLKAAYEAFSVVLNWVFLASGFLSIAIALLSTVFVAVLVPGFSSEDRATTAALVATFAPLLMLQVGVAFLKALAHAQQLFGWPEGLAFASLLIQLLVLILFHDAGVIVLFIGLSVGLALQILGLLFVLRRDGFKYVLIFRHANFSPATLFKKLLSTSVYTLSAQLSSVVITAALSNLPQGTYAGYSYALRMQSKISSVLLRPISIVFFTHFSEAVVAGSQKIREISALALNRSLILTSLAVMVMLTSADSLLYGLLYNADFPASRISLITDLLAIFVISFYLLGVGQIARKMVVSFDGFDLQYYCFALGQIINSILIWYVLAGFGEAGIYFVIIFGANFMSVISLILLLRIRADAFSFYRLSECLRWAVLLALIIMVMRFIPFIDLVQIESYKFAQLVSGIVEFTFSLVLFLLLSYVFKLVDWPALFRRA